MSAGGPSALCRLLMIAMVSAARGEKLWDPDVKWECSYKFIAAGAVIWFKPLLLSCLHESRRLNSGINLFVCLSNYVTGQIHICISVTSLQGDLCTDCHVDIKAALHCNRHLVVHALLMHHLSLETPVWTRDKGRTFTEASACIYDPISVLLSVHYQVFIHAT